MKSQHKWLPFAATFAFASTLAFAAAVAPPLFAQANPPERTTSPSEATFVIRGARVFDGERVLSGADVWIESGRIKAVGPHLQTSPNVREIDAHGDTLLPGLIDAHTHTWGDALKQALLFGVTTELDMFSDPKFDADVRSKEAAGQNHDAADLRSSGTLVTVEKGHGTEYGIKIPVLASPAEAQSFVDARLAEGSDYIKIIYDNGSAYGLTLPTLTKEELAAVVAAAHKRHKLAVVHIGSQAGARDAIEAGADALVHIFEDEPPAADFSKFAKDHHTFVVATLSVNESVSGKASGASLATDARLSPYIDSASVTNLQKSFPFGPASKVNFANALSAVTALHKAGVPVLAGTDAPNPGTAHGVSIHREMQLLVQAGLTPSEALSAATSIPARAFGLIDRGRIAPGLRADLLLVKGDPTQDIAATRDIVSIWKTGFEYDRASARNAVEKEKQEAAAARAAAPPAGSEQGLISNFEDGTLNTKFGSGFAVSTDSIAGGKSTADLKVIEGGPANSKNSLQISGTISDAFVHAWAGAMFSPAATPFAPANLSSRKAIHFWVRGDGRTCRVMLFTQSTGYMPFQKPFPTGPDWKEVFIPFTDLGGTDGHDISAILFTASPEPGAFTFAIANISLQ
jgi:imidazolonepropionase-like amidohydrolase